MHDSLVYLNRNDWNGFRSTKTPTEMPLTPMYGVVPQTRAEIRPNGQVLDFLLTSELHCYERSLMFHNKQTDISPL